MFAELRELLRSGAIRRHQLGPKYLLTPMICHQYIVKEREKQESIAARKNLCYSKEIRKIAENCYTHSIVEGHEVTGHEVTGRAGWLIACENKKRERLGMLPG